MVTWTDGHPANFAALGDVVEVEEDVDLGEHTGLLVQQIAEDSCRYSCFGSDGFVPAWPIAWMRPIDDDIDADDEEIIELLKGREVVE